MRCFIERIRSTICLKTTLKKLRIRTLFLIMKPLLNLIDRQLILKINNRKNNSCVMNSKFLVKPGLWILIWIVSAMMILSACRSPTGAIDTPPLDVSGRILTPQETLQINSTTAVTPTVNGTIEQNLQFDPAFGYTYHSPDGNRLVQGAGALLGSTPVDVPLNTLKRLSLESIIADSGADI